MNHYELMVIFSPNLTEDEQKDQLRQVEEILNKEKATMHFVDHWGKRKLAYPVKKQRQGYYEWFYFELDPSRIAEVERKLKMTEPVLRFMTIRMEKHQIQYFQKDLARRRDAAANAAAAASAAAAAASAPPAQEAEEPAAPATTTATAVMEPPPAEEQIAAPEEAVNNEPAEGTQE